MKKKIIALSALVTLALSIGVTISGTSKKASAEGAGYGPTLVETQYECNYHEYPTGTLSADDLYHSSEHDALLWMEHGRMEVIENDGKRFIKTTVNTDDGGGYAKLLGIGGGQIGLPKLVDGRAYQFQMYLDMGDATGELYVEYSARNFWTGVKLVNGAVVVLDRAHAFNASYKNKILTFNFYAREESTDGARPFIHTTLAGARVGMDVITFGAFTIKDAAQYEMNFEQYAVGNYNGAAAEGAADGITNLYTESLAASVKADSNDNHYLSLTATNPGDRRWTDKFYLNRMWGLIDGHTYRFSMDLLSHNYVEMYVKYNDDWRPFCFAFNSTGYAYTQGDPSQVLKAFYFDGTHLAVDVVFTSQLQDVGDWWRQLCIQFCTEANSTLTIDIDNISLMDLSIMGTELIVEGYREEFAYGTELDTTGTVFSMKRADNTTFYVGPITGSYLTYTSNYNKTQPGQYTVTYTLKDSIGKEITASCTVKVLDKAVAIEVVTGLDNHEIYYGHALDLTGLTIHIVMASGEHSAPIPVTADMVTGFNPEVVGEQELTITLRGLTTTFKVTVLDYDTGIRVTAPTKVTYNFGEPLSLAGGTVSFVTASGETSGTVALDSNDVTVFGYNPFIIGDQIIIVIMGGYTASFGIKVIDYDGFIQAVAPSKVVYSVGEDLDATGGQIIIYTASGQERVEAMSASMISGYDKDKVGTQTVTVTYNGLTSDFVVTVVAASTGANTVNAGDILGYVFAGLGICATIALLVIFIKGKEE